MSPPSLHGISIALKEGRDVQFTGSHQNLKNNCNKFPTLEFNEL